MPAGRGEGGYHLLFVVYLQPLLFVVVYLCTLKTPMRASRMMNEASATNWDPFPRQPENEVNYVQ